MSMNPTNGARAQSADPGNGRNSFALLARTMLHGETPLDRANHRMQRLELSCQYDQARTSINVASSDVRQLFFDRKHHQVYLEHFPAALNQGDSQLLLSRRSWRN